MFRCSMMSRKRFRPTKPSYGQFSGRRNYFAMVGGKGIDENYTWSANGTFFAKVFT